MTTEPVRPTKKQRELLDFIQSFINEHNYSPSYREIMAGLNYTSVATVALHVNSLIKRGHLIRRDGKARSLEVSHRQASDNENNVPQTPEAWLLDQAHHHITAAENAETVTPEALSDIDTLLESLNILDIDSGEHDFTARLAALRT